jgi:ABC-2 type transport system ATP-binding protein
MATRTPRPVIQVSGFRKTYRSTVAVDDVSFEVYDGEIFGLIGPNGAGKTTTMECVQGLRTPDRGTISVLGLDPFRDVYALQDRIGAQLLQPIPCQPSLRTFARCLLGAAADRCPRGDAGHDGVMGHARNDSRR